MRNNLGHKKQKCAATAMAMGGLASDRMPQFGSQHSGCQENSETAMQLMFVAALAATEYSLLRLWLQHMIHCSAILTSH
jgi:hypothetical protein